MKKFIRIFCIVFSIFIILAATFAVFITISPGEALLSRILVKQLSTSLGMTVKLDALETNLFNRLELKQLQILYSDSTKTEPLAYFPSVQIIFNPIDLLRSPMKIAAVEVDSTIINLMRDNNGVYQIPLFAQHSEEDSEQRLGPFEIIIERTLIKSMDMVYEDRFIPINSTVYDLNLNLTQESIGNYMFQMNIDSIGFNYYDLPLTAKNLYGFGYLQNDGLNIDSLYLDLSDFVISGHISIDSLADLAGLNGKLTIVGDAERLGQQLQEFIPSAVLPISGRVVANLQLSGNIEKYSLFTQIELDRFNIAKIEIYDGFVQGIWQADSFYLDPSFFNAFDGNITAQGVLSLDSSLNHKFSLSIRDLNLHEIWQFIAAQKSHFSGKVNGSISTAGPLLQPNLVEMDARLVLQNVTYKDKAIQDFNAVLNLHQQCASLQFDQAESQIRANVCYVQDNLVGNFNLAVRELQPMAALMNISELRGSMQVVGEIRGNINAPQIEAKLFADNIRFQNFPIDTLKGDLRIENETVYFRDMIFNGVLSQVDSLYPPFYIDGLRGSIHYRGQIDGPLDNPTAVCSAIFKKPGYFDVQFDSGHVNILYREQLLDLKTVQFFKDSLVVKVVGDYQAVQMRGGFEILSANRSVEQTGDSRINGNIIYTHDSSYILIPDGKIIAHLNYSDTTAWVLDMHGEDIKTSYIQAIYQAPIPIFGRLFFDLHGVDFFSNPIIDIPFFITSPAIYKSALDSLSGHLRIMENKVHLDNLAIYSERGSFSGSAVIPFEQSPERGYHIPETEPVQGYFEWSDLEMEVLQSSFFKEIQLTGYSHGQLFLKGSINQPMINGYLSIKNGFFQLDPKTPQVNDIDIFIAFKDSSFRLEQFDGSIKSMPFELMGEISSTNWERFKTNFNLNLSNVEVLSGSGTIAGDSVRLNLLMNQFNLAILQPFFSEFQQINGRIYAKLDITGLVNNPRIKGFTEISDLSFKPISINQTFSDGIIKATFDLHQMTLDTLSLRQDGGRIFAQGRVLEYNGNISQLEMNLDISDIRLERPDQFSVAINRGQLSYIKQNDYFQLDGDIRLGESHLINRFQPKDIISFFKTVEKPSHSRPEMLQRTKLNIRLKESGQVWVDNNLSNLRLRPELTIIGSATQPNITGRLVVEEGYILYLDRKFQVVKGILDFIDPNRLNPIVDLKAVAKIKNYQTLNAIPYTISITITGPLDQVVFELTSEPTLEKSDIVALLTVGATRAQLTKKEGGNQVTISDALKDRLAVISSEKVSGYAARTVGNLFGLEAVSIEGNLFRFGKSWGPQLLASKKLSDRVEITYTTTVGRMNEQNIRLDYLLSRYFSMEGQTDQRGKSGLDVKYRLEFK